jgi:regulator of replication initiation timing
MPKEDQIKKLKEKVQELQKVNIELTKAGGKLALENMDLKKKLDKKKRK